MKPLNPESAMGRLLLILRAGPIEAAQLRERNPAAYTQAGAAVRAGFASRSESFEGFVYRITDAGRAACPLRNPLAGKDGHQAAAPSRRPALRTTKGTFSMQKVTVASRILAAVRERGSVGISRQALLQALPDIGKASLDSKLTELAKVGDIHRPHKGWIVAGKAPVDAAQAAHEPSVRELLAQNAEKREEREVREARELEDMPGSVFTDDPHPIFTTPLKAQVESMTAERPADVTALHSHGDRRLAEAADVPVLGNHIGGGRFYLAEPLILIGSDRQLRIREGGAELILTREQTAELAQLMAALPVTSERRAA